jgi:hypothetical protein
VAGAGRNEFSSDETIDSEGEDVLNMVELEVEQRREMWKTTTDKIEMNLGKGTSIDTDTVTRRKQSREECKRRVKRKEMKVNTCR